MSDSYTPNRLDGKVALVTGSRRGIGAAIALYLSQLSAKVVVNYANSTKDAKKVVAQIKESSSKAIAFKANIRQVSQIVKLFNNAISHFSRLNIAISNSGVVSFSHLKDVTKEEFNQVFSLNTRGQFFVAREAYLHLNKGS